MGQGKIKRDGVANKVTCFLHIIHLPCNSDNCLHLIICGAAVRGAHPRTTTAYILLVFLADAHYDSLHSNFII